MMITKANRIAMRARTLILIAAILLLCCSGCCTALLHESVSVRETLEMPRAAYRYKNRLFLTFSVKTYGTNAKVERYARLSAKGTVIRYRAEIPPGKTQSPIPLIGVESRAAALDAQNKDSVFWWIDPADRKKSWCQDSVFCWMDPSEGAWCHVLFFHGDKPVEGRLIETDWYTPLSGYLFLRRLPLSLIC
jgi:hypothetical protein